MKISHYDRYGNEFIKFDIIPNLPNVVKNALCKNTRKKLRFLLSKKHTCAICGAKAYYIGYYKSRQNNTVLIDLYTKNGVVFNIDHIIPVSKGGANTDENKQCTCHNCNTKKDNKLIEGMLVIVKGGSFVPYKK